MDPGAACDSAVRAGCAASSCGSRCPGTGTGPTISVYQAPEEVQGYGPVRFLLGSYGSALSAIESPSPINHLAVRLKAGERWLYKPPSDHTVLWVAVASGVVSVPGELRHGDLAAFEPASEAVEFEALTDTEFSVLPPRTSTSWSMRRPAMRSNAPSTWLRNIPNAPKAGAYAAGCSTASVARTPWPPCPTRRPQKPVPPARGGDRTGAKGRVGSEGGQVRKAGWIGLAGSLVRHPRVGRASSIRWPKSKGGGRAVEVHGAMQVAAPGRWRANRNEAGLDGDMAS